MFESLLSKFKKQPAKEVKKANPAPAKTKAKSGGSNKSDNVLLFGSIGLIVLGVAAIVFEALTSSDAPVPQQTAIPKPAAAAKPAAPKPAPASAPASATAVASAPAIATVKPK